LHDDLPDLPKSKPSLVVRLTHIGRKIAGSFPFIIDTGAGQSVLPATADKAVSTVNANLGGRRITLDRDESGFLHFQKPRWTCALIGRDALEIEPVEQACWHGRGDVLFDTGASHRLCPFGVTAPPGREGLTHINGIKRHTFTDLNGSVWARTPVSSFVIPTAFRLRDISGGVSQIFSATALHGPSTFEPWDGVNCADITLRPAVDKPSKHDDLWKSTEYVFSLEEDDDDTDMPLMTESDPTFNPGATRAVLFVNQLMKQLRAGPPPLPFPSGAHHVYTNAFESVAELPSTNVTYGNGVVKAFIGAGVVGHGYGLFTLGSCGLTSYPFLDYALIGGLMTPNAIPPRNLVRVPAVIAKVAGSNAVTAAMFPSSCYNSTGGKFCTLTSIRDEASGTEQLAPPGAIVGTSGYTNGFPVFAGTGSAGYIQVIVDWGFGGGNNTDTLGIYPVIGTVANGGTYGSYVAPAGPTRTYGSYTDTFYIQVSSFAGSATAGALIDNVYFIITQGTQTSLQFVSLQSVLCNFFTPTDSVVRNFPTAYWDTGVLPGLSNA